MSPKKHSKNDSKKGGGPKPIRKWVQKTRNLAKNSVLSESGGVSQSAKISAGASLSACETQKHEKRPKNSCFWTIFDSQTLRTRPQLPPLLTRSIQRFGSGGGGISHILGGVSCGVLRQCGYYLEWLLTK